MIKLKAATAVALVSTLVFLSGCATVHVAKEAAGQPDSVSVVLLSQKDLGVKFGSDPDKNPFLPQAGIILPPAYDYVVAKLGVVTALGTEVELLQAEVDDANNEVKARFYDRKSFTDLVCSLGMSGTAQVAAKRRSVVDWYYLPSQSLSLKHGKHEYIMVFIGKHPLPDDLSAYISVMVDGEEHEFTLDVPNAKK
jgi:hypothetical protein